MVVALVVLIVVAIRWARRLRNRSAPPAVP